MHQRISAETEAQDKVGPDPGVGTPVPGLLLPSAGPSPIHSPAEQVRRSGTERQQQKRTVIIIIISNSFRNISLITLSLMLLVLEILMYRAYFSSTHGKHSVGLINC